MSDEHPDVEDRLRRAIESRTSSVEPGDTGLARIEEMIMNQTMSSRRQRGWLIALTSAAAAIVVLLAVVIAQGDDDETVDSADDPTTTTTDDTTSSTDPTFAPTVDPAVPVWPVVDTSQRFDDPVAAARSFAVDFLGFTDPIVGEFQQGDNRSGEVAVRKRAQGTPTVVFVRQLEDDAWWVIGAESENITLEDPEAGDTLTPGTFTVAGVALAFEGHVNVDLYADGVEEPLTSGFVTGGGGPAAPFQGEFDWPAAPTDYGVLVLATYSAEDGSLFEATVIRVKLR